MFVCANIQIFFQIIHLFSVSKIFTSGNINSDKASELRVQIEGLVKDSGRYLG